MKVKGYRFVLRMYLVFFLVMIGAIVMALTLFFKLITVQKEDGSMVRSNWPKVTAEEFGEQIIWVNGQVQVKQKGTQLLQENNIGLEIVDDTGKELYDYPMKDLKEGTTTSFEGGVKIKGEEYSYTLFFPMKISKITMYLNGEQFTGGKRIIFTSISVIVMIVLVTGILYGVWMAKTMKRLTESIYDIAHRSYLPVQEHGLFSELYDSLNDLDTEIRTSDKQRSENEKMRKEWIANITHDLKTPLSPIKGYAEILHEEALGEGAANSKSINNTRINSEHNYNESTNNSSTDAVYQRKAYTEIILKNTSYIEKLIDQMKLIYQLESGMVPIKRQEQNIVRFLKELIIDILNMPEYEKRLIQFESGLDPILFSFDSILFTRAFRNLIINALVHGEEDTQVNVKVEHLNSNLRVMVTDNGKGMKEEMVKHLFERYYRGTSTEEKTEGTGLGLVITKHIIELHGGEISVVSCYGQGTSFQINLPLN